MKKSLVYMILINLFSLNEIIICEAPFWRKGLRRLHQGCFTIPSTIIKLII